MRTTFCVASVVVVSFLAVTQCELYTSVEETVKWPKATALFSDTIDGYIEMQETKVKRLKKILDSLTVIVNLTAGSEDSDKEATKEIASHNSDSTGNINPMMNPVNAFVVLNRLKRAMDNIYTLLDYHEIDSVRVDYDYLITRVGLKNLAYFKTWGSIDEDLDGSAQALLRLQLFYNLSIDSLINGTMRSESQDWSGQRVLNSSSAQSYQMDAWDCYELGKLAYRNKDFGLAIQWLFKSLEATMRMEDSNSKEEESDEIEELKTAILDYMAYAAYKLGLLEYSAKLTKTWLDRDPDNERAKENLRYYHNVLAGLEDSDTDEEDSYDNLDDDLIRSTDSYLSDSSVTYTVTEDEVVRRLCRGSENVNNNSKNKCKIQRVITGDGEFYPALRVEILNDEPSIIRIHDIITKNEAKYLRQAALPSLERSGVSSSKGSHISENRIAKTAWLESDGDPLVTRIESRLGSILNISMHNAEHFQVVNYGLGGFYGPHFDSSQKKISDSNIDERVATILVYLNHVEAGGSTAFPKLNISVVPIERSAIVWYNMLTNGDRDERTLHTGCPVLLGSKWIATKWPNEQSNSFKRPCKLDDNTK